MALTRIPINVRNAADKKVAEVMIYGPIGADMFGDGVDAKRFAEDLKALGPLDEIHCRVNSPGGSVWDGLAIFNTLVNHKAEVHMHVDGIAASAASFVAMAASPGCLNMAENATMMIHCGSAMTWGNAADHEKTAEILHHTDGTIAATYARRSGRRPETMLKLMADETWMTAAEAKDHGLADKVTPAKKVAACVALDKLAARYPKLPAAVAETLTAVAADDAAADPPPAEPVIVPAPAPAAAAADPAVAVKLRLVELDDE